MGEETINIIYLYFSNYLFIYLPSLSILLSIYLSRDWTVGEATINMIVGAEIICWFFIGECIGKSSLVGYQVIYLSILFIYLSIYLLVLHRRVYRKI